MKKIIIGLMFLLMVSSVFAVKNQERVIFGKDNTVQEAGERLALQVENKERIENGLTKSLQLVENPTTRQKIEQNIEKFEEKMQNRLQVMEQVTVQKVNSETGSVEIFARQKVKLLGFIPFKVRNEFKVNSEGEIEERKPWFRFMYKEER